METADKLYVLDKSLEISEISIGRVDDCGFAEFTVNEEKYNYWLKGPSIQTAHYVFGNNTGYLVSLDYKSLRNIKEFIMGKIRGIVRDMQSMVDKIIIENFD